MKERKQQQNRDRSSVLEDRERFERTPSDERLSHMGDKPQKSQRDQGSTSEPSKK